MIARTLKYNEKDSIEIFTNDSRYHCLLFCCTFWHRWLNRINTLHGTPFHFVSFQSVSVRFVSFFRRRVCVCVCLVCTLCMYENNVHPCNPSSMNMYVSTSQLWTQKVFGVQCSWIEHIFYNVHDDLFIVVCIAATPHSNEQGTTSTDDDGPGTSSSPSAESLNDGSNLNQLREKKSEGKRVNRMLKSE